MATSRELSISTSFNYELPIEHQLPLIAAAGFTHVSFGGNAAHAGYLTPTGRERLGSLLQKHGLRLDTIHGPRADQAESRDALAAVIEAAAALGAPVVVAHPGPFDFPAEELPARFDAVLRTCGGLTPTLRRAGVVLALENVLPGPATDLVRLALPRLDPRWFGFCYDSAHDQIGGPRPFDLLAELGERVRAVHLSDRVRDFVDHVPPGDGFIEWPALCAALSASSFAGPLLFEVMMTHSAEHDSVRFLRLAYERGCLVYDQIMTRRS